MKMKSVYTAGVLSVVAFVIIACGSGSESGSEGSTEGLTPIAAPTIHPEIAICEATIDCGNGVTGTCSGKNCTGNGTKQCSDQEADGGYECCCCTQGGVSCGAMSTNSSGGRTCGGFTC